MDLQFTSGEIAFRQEIREQIRRLVPEDIRRKCLLGQRLDRSDIIRWTRILHEKGWATPNWPAQWGGPGWTAVQQYIFKEELYLAPAPELLTFNVNMIGPVLIAFGTPAQKEHFLPRIARLDCWFCQGFSEPDAGSDLASLRTQARLDGDHYIVTGQKIWTTLAHHADWCFLLVRTDPKARPQRGITYLLMDMKTPGVTVRPIVTIDGNHEFNEVFLDKVEIPVINRVGEEGRGWDYAKFLLSNERTHVARVGLCKMRLRRARELASQILVDGCPLSEEPRFRERAAALDIELKALEVLQMRALAGTARAADSAPDAMAPILKIKGADLQQATSEFLLEVAGYDAMELDIDFLRGAPVPLGGDERMLTVAPNHYWLRHTSISAGTNEIQRNILAKRVLGL